MNDLTQPIPASISFEVVRPIYSKPTTAYMLKNVEMDTTLRFGQRPQVPWRSQPPRPRRSASSVQAT